MTDTRPKYIKLTTPKMTFKWPKLSKPDYGSKDYPCPEGKFSVNLVGSLDDPAIKAFLEIVRPHYELAERNAEDAFKALKAETRKKLGSVKMNSFYTELLDPETEQPTGDIEIKASMRASGEFKRGPKAGSRWTASPAIFDAKGAPLKSVPDIWGGTVGRVSIEFPEGGYFIPGTGAAGLQLQLRGVQIVDLVSGGQRTAAAHGFGAEDGYEYVAPAHSDAAAGEGFSNEAGAGDADF